MKNQKLALFSLAILPLLSSCGEDPEWVAVYEDCKAQIAATSAEMDKAAAESDNSPEVEAMMESMGGMAMNFGLSACEMIRSSCENDPDGRACQAIIEQSKNNK